MGVPTQKRLEPSAAPRAYRPRARTGFDPQVQGFAFPNSFPRGPLLRVGVGPLRFPVGDAARGVCGGMVFAAADVFHHGRAAPALERPPPPGSAAFRFLVRRAFASFDIPTGPLRYLWWMWLPDRGGAAPAARTLRNLRGVLDDIDSGRPSPVGLVRTRSWNPMDLGLHHQVLAYAYERGGAKLTFHVYDPNHPRRDDLRLQIHVAAAASGRPGAIRYIDGEAPVRGFFRTRYAPADPSPLFEAT